MNNFKTWSEIEAWAKDSYGEGWCIGYKCALIDIMDAIKLHTSDDVIDVKEIEAIKSQLLAREKA